MPVPEEGRGGERLLPDIQPPKGYPYELGKNSEEIIAWDSKVCFAYADAMLAEWDKGAGSGA
jgi:hypothetical protein